MEINTIIILFFIAQLKVAAYAIWNISKRLQRIESNYYVLKKVVTSLHRKELTEIRSHIDKITRVSPILEVKTDEEEEECG